MQKEEIKKAGGNEVSFSMPDTESIGKLTEMNKSFSLNLRYKTQEDWIKLEDKELRCYYMGMREIPNDKEEMVNCALFVSESECFISGQMLLVDAVEKLEIRTPVSITYRGKKKNAKSEGSTNQFDVFKLSV